MKIIKQIVIGSIILILASIAFILTLAIGDQTTLKAMVLCTFKAGALWVITCLLVKKYEHMYERLNKWLEV